MNRLSRPGIIWDPREPIPSRFVDSTTTVDAERTVQSPNISYGLRAIRKLKRNIRAFRTHVPDGTSERFEDTTRKPNDVPDLTSTDGGYNVLAPRSISLQTSIVHDIATTVSEQIYLNNADSIIPEAVYTFPLPSGCAVSSFTCRVGTSKTLEGVIKRKEEARNEYEKRVAKGYTAAVLEQDTPEIFTTSLGNIPANTKVKIEITFITVLKHHFEGPDGLTTLTIPTSIASRYGPPDIPRRIETVGGPQGLTIEVEIQKANSIISVISHTHDISTEMSSVQRTAHSWAELTQAVDSGDSNRAFARLKEDGAFLHKDFVLEIVTKSTHSPPLPQAWLEQHPSLDNHRALMVSFPPDFMSTSAEPTDQSEIIFVVDRSGSMSDKMVALKSAMTYFLKGIPVGKKFNIWSFGDSYVAWRPVSVDYDERTLFSALSHVEHFASNLGGTELLSALSAVVTSKDSSLRTDIIVLTDGEVWRLEQTLSLVRKTMASSNDVRFFSLGIGDRVSHALVEGIGRIGGGYSEIISAQRLTAWEDRLVAMTKAILTTKRLQSLRLRPHYDGPKMNDICYDNVDIPDVVSQIRGDNRVYAFLDATMPTNFDSLIMHISTHDGLDSEVKIPICHPEQRGVSMHKLTARMHVDSLQNELRTLEESETWDDHCYSSETQRLRLKIEDTAIKWSLVSSYTSLFLVGETSESPGQHVRAIEFEVGSGFGYDLLSNRFAGTRYPLPSDAAHSIPSARLSSRLAPPPARYKKLPILRKRPHHEGARVVAAGMSNLFGKVSGSSPYPITHNYRRRPLLCSKSHHVGPFREHYKSGLDRAQDNTRRQYINLLLWYQRYDGSFHFDSYWDANGVLGSDIVEVLQPLLQQSPPATIYTLAILAILLRDFKEEKAQWELMYDKAMQYLHDRDEEGQSLEDVSTRIKDIELDPSSRLIAAGEEEQSRNSHSERSAGDGDCADYAPYYKIVERAPYS